MRKTVVIAIGVLALSLSANAQEYTVDGLITDEMELVVKSKTSSLEVYSEPNISSKITKIAVKQGKILGFDEAKTIITETVTLTSKSSFPINCFLSSEADSNSKTYKISANQKVEYLMPLIPDGMRFYYKNLVCEVEGVNDKMFTDIKENQIRPSKSPKAQKWIRVINDKSIPQGWLLLNSGSLSDFSNSNLKVTLKAQD
jgi:hypothetical protein